MLAGNGIRLSNAQKEFDELVEVLQIPVLTTWNGIDLIEDNNPYFLEDQEGWGKDTLILSNKIQIFLCR